MNTSTNTNAEYQSASRPVGSVINGVEIIHERLLKTLFVLIWALALIHMTAEYFYLYWTFRWFDIFTHFLGGVWVGLATIWIWYFSEYLGKTRIPGKEVLLIAILGGLIVGCVWEGYEYVVWMWSGQGLPVNYVADSSLDLVMDVVGALFGFFIYSFIQKKVIKSQSI